MLALHFTRLYNADFRLDYVNPSSLALHTNAICNTVNDMLVYLAKTIIIIIVGKPNTNPGHARQRRQGTTSLVLPQQGAIFNHFLQSKLFRYLVLYFFCHS